MERGTPTAGTADAGQEKSLPNTEQVAGKQSQEIQNDNTSDQSCPTQETLALMAAIGCIWTLSLVGGPKLVPMAVAAGFIQRAEVAKAGLSPELPAAFEPRLLLTAGRFDRS